MTMFKYLGAELQHKSREYQGAYAVAVRRKTDMYLGSVKSMARSSPDPSRFARELWARVAILAILYGYEAIPIRKEELKHLNSAAASIGKFSLGLGVGAANVVAALAAGVQTGRYQYLQKFMRYHEKIETGKADNWLTRV